AVAPARPAPKNPEQEYAAALATYRAREHGQAVIDFKDFIAQYPKHPLAGNAQYWIGEAYWAQRDYRQALIEFEKVFEHRQAKAPRPACEDGPGPPAPERRPPRAAGVAARRQRVSEVRPSDAGPLADRHALVRPALTPPYLFGLSGGPGHFAILRILGAISS